MYTILESLKTLINKHDVISFDIFDTLLLRPYAEPRNVFQHLENIYGTVGFTHSRDNAIINLINRKNINNADYDDIYNFLPQRFFFLKEKELQLEIDTLYANPEMKCVFDYVKNLNKKIIIVSDMYYSSKILDSILKKNGYTGYDKIYVSGEIKKSKGEGLLFHHIKEELNIEYNNIFHIGDNIHSDYNIPISLGINAYNYIKPLDQFLLSNKKMEIFFNTNKYDFTTGIIVGIIVKRFIFNELPKDYWKYLGYYLGGALCYGLSKFVYNEVIKENIKDVLFIARDGYTIEKIFNLINDNKYNINTYYLYSSRSINLEICKCYKNPTSWWIERIDLFIEIFKKISPQFLSMLPEQFDDIDDKITFLINNEDILNDLSDKILEKYTKYINNFNISSNKIAMFDTAGFAFNSMKLLKKIFPNADILGLYWCINSEDRDDFWCKAYQKMLNVFFEYYDILEFLITAPELPLQYLDENGKFYFSDNKYEKVRAEIYKDISYGEILFSEDLLSIFKNYSVDFDCYSLVTLTNIFINNLDDMDISKFSNILHSSDELHTVYKQFLNLKKIEYNNQEHNNPEYNNISFSLLAINNFSLFSIDIDNKYIKIQLLGIKITIKK
ncbi:HAD-IA family hydrolase [Brachyspira pilosicoli]|uniref:HAD-IA family hydrolase n=1 Tax=Brachyspira pilosicoli TaxID=52584 RepID=UPI003003CB05